MGCKRESGRLHWLSLSFYMKGVCLWDTVVPEWVFCLLEVEVYCLKIYGKYGGSRQHSGSARKREGIALLLPPNHLWVLCLAFILMLRFACNLLAERSGIEEKKKAEF